MKEQQHQTPNYESELQKHINRCRVDPRYYFASELSVVDEAKNIVKFGELWPTQKKVQDAIDSDRSQGRPSRIIVLKARRHRISTLAAANIFHGCIFNANARGYIVAHDNDTTSRLFEMHRVFYENLTNDMRPMRRMSNAREMRFENPEERRRVEDPGLRSSLVVRCAMGGSRKLGDLQNAAGVGRGDRIDYFHGSETAFWPDAEQTFRGFAQAVPEEPGTLVMMESTGNGAAGGFYDAWREACDGGEYTPIFLPWFEHPLYRASIVGQNRPEWMPGEDETKRFEEYKGYVLLNELGKAESLAEKMDLDEDEKNLVSRFSLDWDQLKWRRWCIRSRCQNRLSTFQTEYPAYPEEAFAASGSPRFNNQKLRFWFQDVKESSAGELVPAEGAEFEPTGGGWKEIKMKFEQKSAGQIQLIDFPKENHSYVIGADASHGVGSDSSALAIFDRTDRRYVGFVQDSYLKADKLAELMIAAGWYYNMAWLAPEFNGPGVLTSHILVQSGYPRLYYSQRWNSGKSEFTSSPGFVTDSRSRDLLIDRFDIAIERDEIAIEINEILQEALTFVLDQKRGRADHLPGSHDDVLFSAMIALFVDGQVSMDEKKRSEEKFVWRKTPPTVCDILDKPDKDEESFLFY